MLEGRKQESFIVWFVFFFRSCRFHFMNLTRPILDATTMVAATAKRKCIKLGSAWNIVNIFLKQSYSHLANIFWFAYRFQKIFFRFLTHHLSTLSLPQSFVHIFFGNWPTHKYTKVKLVKWSFSPLFSLPIKRKRSVKCNIMWLCVCTFYRCYCLLIHYKFYGKQMLVSKAIVENDIVHKIKCSLLGRKVFTWMFHIIS